MRCRWLPLLCLAWAPAAAGTVPVSDAETLETYRSLLQSADEMVRSLGDVAQPGTMLGNLAGLQQAIGAPGIPAASGVRSMPRLPTEGLAPAPDRWAGTSDWSSFAGARQAVLGQLFASAGGGQPPTLLLQGVTSRRALAVRRATEDAAALALAARTRLIADGAAIERLALRSDAADLRTAVQANTDALLAVHDRATETALLLTALLELRAVRTIETDSPWNDR